MPRDQSHKIIPTDILILLKNDNSKDEEYMPSKQLEIAMLNTECSSKIYKPLLYNKAITIQFIIVVEKRL